MNNRQYRYERSGFPWWPLALGFVLFMFFWGGRGLFWFFSGPLLLIVPILLFFGVVSWFRHGCDTPYDGPYDGPQDGRGANFDDMFYDDQWEKPKRNESPEKPKRGDNGSEIYYL